MIVFFLALCVVYVVTNIWIGVGRLVMQSVNCPTDLLTISMWPWVLLKLSWAEMRRVPISSTTAHTPSSHGTLEGLGNPHDRLWEILTPQGLFYLTDYNDEITGFSRGLHDLYPDIVHYGGNAYYVTGKFAEKVGWSVIQLDRDQSESLWNLARDRYGRDP